MCNYFMPTRIVAGQGCLREHGPLLKELGHKALIVTGARSAKTNGSIDDAFAALQANGQSWAVFDKVMANPTVECTLEGAERLKAEGCDFVLAIGGGSPLDAGKAMALLGAADAMPETQHVFSMTWKRVLPVAAVPTTAGTGSEVTQYAILTNHAAQTKTSIANSLIFPRLAFLDAGYMRDLPHTVTVNTAVDALSHAVEGMLSVRASVLSDGLAKESIRLIRSCFAAMRRDALEPEDRATLLYASTLAGMVIANTGTTAVHALGYSLTYYRDIDHGRANGLLLPGFLEFTAKDAPERISAILACMGMESVAEFSDAMDGLLGNRESLTSEECAFYAEKAAKAANIANCIVRPGQEDLLTLLRLSLG